MKRPQNYGQFGASKESSMSEITIASIVLKCLDLIKRIVVSSYSYFTNRRRVRETVFSHVANKYYDKVCVARLILHCVRGVSEKDMSNLVDINRMICGELQNLHLCDHVYLDLSKIKDTLGADARKDVIGIENGFAELDKIGVGVQFSNSIDSSKVRSACNAIEKSWNALLVEVSKRINKSVADIEQDLWDAHNPL